LLSRCDKKCPLEVGKIAQVDGLVALDIGGLTAGIDK
jgi:hypothetical protein